MRLVVIAPQSLGQGPGVQGIAHRGGLLQRQSRSGMDRSKGWTPPKTEPFPVGAHPVGDGL